MNAVPIPLDVIENFTPVALGSNEQEFPLELRDLDRKVYRFMRDFSMEKQIIKASRIEKKLRDHSFSSTIQEALSGSWNGVAFFSSNGNFNIMPTVPYQPAPFERIESVPFDRQPYSEPLIQWLSLDPSGMLQPQGLLNGSPAYSTPFIYLRSSYLSSWFGVLSPAWPESSFAEEDQKAIAYFGEHLQLDGEWHTDMQNKGAFRRAFIDYHGFFDMRATVIPVKSAEDVLLFHLELLPYNGKYLLLPVAFFQYPAFCRPLRLYMPPSGKLPLLGLEKLARYPELPVILSEEAALAYMQRIGEINAIFLSPIGDRNTLEHTDFTPLQGRKVSWLICDWNDADDPAHKYKTACKVANLLAGHQISVQFISISLGTWKTPENPMSPCQQASIRNAQLLSKEEMWQKAEAHGIVVERPQLPDSPKMADANELENEFRLPYLIEPVIREGSSTVIFGATGVAKSWIALALGCAVAYGKKAFVNRWVPTSQDGGKVLIIAGEMDQGEYGERLRRLNAHYCPTELQKNNLLLHIVEGTVDLAAANGLEQIQAIISHAEKSRGRMGDPIKMVILDNLTTLSTEGENPANFGKIEQVLKWLKARGIAVILIHHENGQGDIRGARKIGDVMTSKFHLYPGDTEGDCIGVIIKNEKNRSNKASDMDTFKVVFDFEEPASGFREAPLTDADLKRIKEVPEDDNEEEKPIRPRKTRYNQTAWKAMSHEERVNAIMEAFRRGDSNEEIAANHNTSRTTICNFRKEYQLRDQDLKQE